MQCGTVQREGDYCGGVQYCTVQCGIVQSDKVRCCEVLCCTARASSVVLKILVPRS